MRTRGRYWTAFTIAMMHRGERIGNIPFGYDVGTDGICLAENTGEQEVIAEVRKRRCDGMSYRAIAAILNARGIAAKAGGRWHPQAVLNVCKRCLPSDTPLTRTAGDLACSVAQK